MVFSDNSPIFEHIYTGSALEGVIDIDKYEAESQQRARTYYDTRYFFKIEPISLNQKNLWDRVLGDSMAAAILGHPGAYYTQAPGTAEGITFTADVLATPPNFARLGTGLLGFFEFLGVNLIMPGAHSAVYYGLTFDSMKLDWF